MSKKEHADKPTSPTTNTGSILHELHGFWPQIMRMAWVDIQKEYKGAIFNWLWAIARPLIYLLVYWFVLKFGLKANTMAGKAD